jgi:large subunit ribosomal protein L9
MKVILKEYVYKHGVAGDVVNVSDGFARNYLIPRGLAVKATNRALEESASLVAEAAMRRNELNERLVAVAKQIDGVELVFGRKAGSNGKLYGSVTTMDIAQALLDKTGVDINRRRISERPLRELGSYDVPVRMGHELSPTLRVTIVREEDLAAYLSGGVETVVERNSQATPAAEDEMDEAAALEEMMASVESQPQTTDDDDDD